MIENTQVKMHLSMWLSLKNGKSDNFFLLLLIDKGRDTNEELIALLKSEYNCYNACVLSVLTSCIAQCPVKSCVVIIHFRKKEKAHDNA